MKWLWRIDNWSSMRWEVLCKSTTVQYTNPSQVSLSYSLQHYCQCSLPMSTVSTVWRYVKACSIATKMKAKIYWENSQRRWNLSLSLWARFQNVEYYWAKISTDGSVAFSEMLVKKMETSYSSQHPWYFCCTTMHLYIRTQSVETIER